MIKPRSISYILATFRKNPYQKSDDLSLSLAIEWVKTAAEISNRNGVPYGYSLRKGWGNSYPETTGYIVETLWDYFEITGDTDSKMLAIDLTDWELKVQNQDGGFPEGTAIGSQSEIFNSGMVLFGLVKSYEKTGDRRYIEAAQRCGDFIVSAQEENGLWLKYGSSLVKNAVKSYHTRVSWALLRLFQITQNERYKTAAIKNLDYVSSHAQENFWIPNMDFDSSGKPLTHSMCYTYRGLFESGILIGNERYIDIAVNASRMLIKSYRQYGYLGVNYTPEWKPTNKCKGLVGSVQFACLFFKIYKLTGEKIFLEAAEEILEFAKSYQPMGDDDKYINGGLTGSIPAYANYFPLTFINWGAKFLADCIMIKKYFSFESSSLSLTRELKLSRHS